MFRSIKAFIAKCKHAARVAHYNRGCEYAWGVLTELGTEGERYWEHYVKKRRSQGKFNAFDEGVLDTIRECHGGAAGGYGTLILANESV